MKGVGFARQGEASDLELVPTWVTVWVRIFDPHRKTTICNKKSPKTEVFEDFWSCWADLNRRHHPYQGCALPTELQQRMATRKGLEPSTSGVTGRRSNQLNYRAIAVSKSRGNLQFGLAGAEGFEPSALGFGDRCSTS